MKLKVAEAVVKCIEAEGIDTIFGYPGGAVLPLYEALRKSNLKHVLVRQEQSAAHMASGYGRSRNGVGVCLATSGPGATNLITGIATAYMDSIPLVAITGQVVSNKIGTDMFQEADIVGATEPFTKHNYLIKSKNDIPRIMKEAFHIANTGRKGPVLIDIPKDIQDETIDFSYPDSVEIRGYKPTYSGNARQIEKAYKRIKEAKQPLICVGGGISSSNSKDELISLVEKTGIPVVCTLMGVDSFPNDSPYFAGLVGAHGYPFVNQAMNKADLIIVVGARFADRSTSTLASRNNQHIIHIDIDPAEIGKTMKTHTPIVGDAKHILSKLAAYDYPIDIDKWSESIRYSRHTYLEDNLQKEWPFDSVNPFRLLQTISNLSNPKTILTADVGQNQIWAAHYFSATKDRKFFTSGGLGTMGYSLPASIGARFGADPSQSVVAIMGEGGFQMLMSELALVKQYDLNIKIFVLSNHRLGMVRELQLHTYNTRDHFHGIDIGFNPDFMKLADAYGIEGHRLTGKENIEHVLTEVFASPGPCLIECSIHPDFPTLAHWRWQ